MDGRRNSRFGNENRSKSLKFRNVLSMLKIGFSIHEIEILSFGPMNIGYFGESERTFVSKPTNPISILVIFCLLINNNYYGEIIYNSHISFPNRSNAADFNCFGLENI